MLERIDKRDRAALFRRRLAEAMGAAAVSQAALARAVGVDRSTVSQLLGEDGPRLPNAQVVAGCAASLGVSSDWLLGLTDRRERAADLLAASMSVSEAPRALVDETIFAWHQEAEGYKIRHVPATLPDMLKTRDVLTWEYTPELGRSTAQAIGASEDRLTWMRAARSDYEIALPLHELSSFARGEGYYAGLPAPLRLAQLDHMAALHAQLYPTLRLFLYDARRVFSAPVTIFGPLIAVLYLGRHYVTFRDRERVGFFTRHFDGLVREASVGAHDVAAHLSRLRADIH